MGQRTQGAAHGVPRRAHGHRGIPSSRKPTPSDPPHSPRLLCRHVDTVTQKQAQRPCGAGPQADLSQLPCGLGRGAGDPRTCGRACGLPSSACRAAARPTAPRGCPQRRAPSPPPAACSCPGQGRAPPAGPASRVRACGRGLWRPRPPTHPLTHGGAARGVVPRRGQGDRGGGGGGRGHGGRGLHSEARRRGLEGQGLLSSSSSVPPPAFPGARAGNHTGR